MLIKNVRMIMNRIWTRSAPSAVFLGSCALLFGVPLQAQDLFLKEYIYLDARLLAVERQVLMQAGRQPTGDSGKEMKFAQYLPSGIHGWTPPSSSYKPGISVIPGMQEMCPFPSPVLAQFLCPDKEQRRFVGSEDFKLRYGAYRRHWKVAGISEHKNGGSYDGL